MACEPGHRYLMGPFMPLCMLAYDDNRPSSSAEHKVVTGLFLFLATVFFIFMFALGECVRKKPPTPQFVPPPNLNNEIDTLKKRLLKLETEARSKQ